MNFTWIVDGQVAAMARPWPEELDELRDAGVAAIVSLTEVVPEGLPHAAMGHLHVPVRDFRAPTIAQLAEAVDFMNGAVAAGGAVAVHCGAGLGRTGTVIASWLVAHGWAPDAAIREVRRRRPGSVETREQEDAVRRFGRELGAQTGGDAGGTQP